MLSTFLWAAAAFFLGRAGFIIGLLGLSNRTDRLAPSPSSVILSSFLLVCHPFVLLSLSDWKEQVHLDALESAVNNKCVSWGHLKSALEVNFEISTCRSLNSHSDCMVL